MKKILITALLIILDVVLYVLYFISFAQAMFNNNMICVLITFPILILATIIAVLIIDLIKGKD